MSIVSNFQDLSAVLSLFAADTVEKKVSNPRANDLERMSTTWSIFGMIGSVRAYIKLISGIHSAEQAGVDIHGFGGYTSEKTKTAMSVRQIGSMSTRKAFQDDREQLLGQVEGAGSQWKRPFIVVMGYSRCPFEGKKVVKEVSGRAVSALLSVAITCIPLLAIRKSIRGDAIDNATLGAAIGTSLIAGCCLPILLHGMNPVGVAHSVPLHDLESQAPGRFEHGLLQDGDTVVTSKKSSTIYWQTSDEEPLPRSGDRMSIRVLAAFATCISITAYVMNYLELGRAPTWRAYVWLGIQTVILALRFAMWAVRPQVLANRSKSLLFVVTGSLVVPALKPSAEVATTTLPRDVVRFAVASAQSKILNLGGTIDNLQLVALDLLSDVAPADILLSDYCSFGELSKSAGEIKAVRLPWSWVEEIYAAQGLILGNNPWALGGLYLAAIVQDGKFRGLSTVHPRGASAAHSHGEDSFASLAKKDHSLQNIVGVTSSNYGMKGTLFDGTITEMLPIQHDLMDWHLEFQENVLRCRASAVSNGPHYNEMHVKNFGEGHLGTKTMSKSVPTIRGVLEQGRKIVVKEKEKDHATCEEFCTIFGF
ncbi:hypothetical protein FIBSPDRAFT_809245 [Athelia psychrophila]|uniref:Uncharacterized protein n=1 Tax=Athelia psychrophila TaxID=1759441 RepID=A0A166WX21_9AGAM|nr:hypothetical protein FIBSPDRAFT_809245 [Fibularhizoctonia sp. CBS 109695]